MNPDPNIVSVEFEQARLIEELRQANDTLIRKLTKARISKDELVTAVYDAVTDTVPMVRLPPVPKPPTTRSTKAAEVAVCLLSDWQLAKVTPDYTSVVCADRVRQYAAKVAELTEIQRHHHPVKTARIYLLGDLVEGELIFPGQSHLIDSSLYTQVIVDGPSILGEFVRAMLAIFEEVHVETVIGNHGALGGRARRDYHPESNADAMMYEVTRQLLADESRLTWGPNMTPGERKWYAIDTVGRHRFFLFHGDQVRGYAGTPWYGFDRKIKGWATVFQHIYQMEGSFQYAVHGHYHTPHRMYANGITIWGNGTTESYNTYALEQLAAAGTPSQWLLFVHPDRGVSCEYEIHLT